MSIFEDFAQKYRQRRQRRIEHRQAAKTYAMIARLPVEIRKDIGWPTAYERQRSRQ